MMRNISGILMGVCGFVAVNSAIAANNYASNPSFLITPTQKAPAVVYTGQVVTATYTIQNNSKNPYTLRGNGVANLPTGVKVIGGSCAMPTFDLSPSASCTVILQITANELLGDIHGGPEVCNSLAHCVHRSIPSSGNQLNVTKSNNRPPVTTYTINASGGANVSVNPSTQQVNYNQTGVVTLSVDPGYIASIAPNNSCGGSLSGNVYTSGPITGNCSVTFSSVLAFPVSKGPSNVFAAPGNGQAVVSWTAPTNTGTGSITQYTVTYGPTSGTSFNTMGCQVAAGTSPLQCTVSGLTNGTEYTFAVTTTTELNGLSQTGPASLSSSVKPTRGLVVSPATLALSGAGGDSNPAHARTITLTNTSGTPITFDTASISSVNFSPSLPQDTLLTTTSCSTLAPDASCTITINPGQQASSDGSQPCNRLGAVPIPSVLAIKDSAHNVIATANVVVLGYGCQYQGGYIFAIDDTTPVTESIGGKVFGTADLSPSLGLAWSTSSASIWGIDDASTHGVPSPSDLSTPATPFQVGQLNCDAVNDGACATHNIQVYYQNSSKTTYAAGLCAEPWTGAGTAACTGGAACYTDWYLPSACDLGPFGSPGGNYPSNPPYSQACITGSTNIELENTLVLSGQYWSSTSDYANPATNAWTQSFSSLATATQSTQATNQTLKVRCARSLTN